jgi:hypothetical protein
MERAAKMNREVGKKGPRLPPQLLKLQRIPKYGLGRIALLKIKID